MIRTVQEKMQRILPVLACERHPCRGCGRKQPGGMDQSTRSVSACHGAIATPAILRKHGCLPTQTKENRIHYTTLH